MFQWKRRRNVFLQVMNVNKILIFDSEYNFLLSIAEWDFTRFHLLMTSSLSEQLQYCFYFLQLLKLLAKVVKQPPTRFPSLAEGQN